MFLSSRMSSLIKFLASNNTCPWIRISLFYFSSPIISYFLFHLVAGSRMILLFFFLYFSEIMKGKVTERIKGTILLRLLSGKNKSFRHIYVDRFPSMRKFKLSWLVCPIWFPILLDPLSFQKKKSRIKLSG